MEFVLKAKNTIKRIAAISAITLMGATAAAGAVAAADLSTYPGMFAESGVWAAQVVMGGDGRAASSDFVAATNLAMAITNSAGAAATTTATTVEGGTKLETADNKLNFYEEIAGPRATLTDSQLAGVLADGKYTNDKGVTFGYTQQIELNTSSAKVQYTEYDDISDSPDAYVYSAEGVHLLTYRMIFTNAAESDITAGELADFKDTTITIMGKDYEITDADSAAGDDKVTLYLMGGAAKAEMFEGDTATYTVNGVDYEVTVSYVGSTTCKLKVNGETTKELSEGQTDKVAGITIGIKEVLENEAGEANAGKDSVEFYLGADKITMEDESVDTTSADTTLTEVKVSEDTIDGVYAEIVMTEVSGTVDGDFDNADVWEMNQLILYYYPDDPMYVYKDHPYVDPALNDWKLELAQITTDNEETIKVNPDASDRIKVTIPMTAGEVEVPAFYYSSSVWYLGKDSDKTFFNDETMDIYGDGDEYFIVSNAGNKESYLMQVSKLDVADAQITFKDVMTGDKYMVTYTDDDNTDAGSDGTFTIGSLTIDIDVNDQNPDAAATTVVRVDMNDDGDFTDLNVPFYTKGGASVKIFNASTAANSSATDAAFNFTSDLDDDGRLDHALCVANVARMYIDFGGNTPTATDPIYTIANVSGTNAAAVATAGWYNGIRFTMSQAAQSVAQADCNMTVTRTAGVSIIEEYQDEGTAYGAIYITVGATASGNTDVTNVYYTDTGGNTNHTDDADFALNAILDTDVQEDYTEYGTKCTLDTTSDQSNAKCVYTDSEAYADVWFSPAGAVVTTGAASGGAGYTMPAFTVAVTDAEASTSKPLILVGGPCVNKLTAQALGVTYPACGAAAVTAGIPENAGIIKIVEKAFDSKTALIVAGWEAAETTAAVNVLKDYKAYADKLKGTGVKVVGTTVTALGAEASVE